MLDFNYAYNPSCAYDPRWSCPLAPSENRMQVPVRGGRADGTGELSGAPSSGAAHRVARLRTPVTHEGGRPCSRKERLLHPATIIAVIALLVALSGAGYAATTIGTSQLKNNAVTTPKIKNAAVNTAKLKNNAVNASKLASNAVTAAKIASNAVTAAKIAGNAVTGAKIAGGAVGVNQIAAGAVDTAKLGNGSVTNDKLGANAVTGAKIAGGTITAANIAPGQVVKGNGSFVTGRQVLTTGALATTVLTLPGVGQLRASCAAGATTISFLNESGAAAAVTAWGVNAAGTPVTQLTTAVGNGASTEGITGAASPTSALGLTYQVVSGANVTTADISAAAAGTSCAVVASGLTTG